MLTSGLLEGQPWSTCGGLGLGLGRGGRGRRCSPGEHGRPDLPLAGLSVGASGLCVLASVPSCTFVVCAVITTDSACVLLFLLHLKADFSPGTQPTPLRGALAADSAVQGQSFAVSTFTLKQLGEDATISIKPWEDSFLSYSKMLFFSICL